MKSALALFAVIGLAAVVGCSDNGEAAGSAAAPAESAPSMRADSRDGAEPSSGETGDDMTDAFVLDAEAQTITGETVDLSAYKGKVVLVVNTASQCGLTPQYEQLQALYEQHKDAGLVVLGFPSNDFNQERGSNESIAEFCDARYGVTFPMFAKVSIKGEGAHPLYAKLNGLSEEPSWNFTKYLIDRDGRFVERFDPRTSPAAETLTARIEQLLARPAAG